MLCGIAFKSSASFCPTDIKITPPETRHKPRALWNVDFKLYHPCSGSITALIINVPISPIVWLNDSMISAQFRLLIHLIIPQTKEHVCRLDEIEWTVPSCVIPRWFITLLTPSWDEPSRKMFWNLNSKLVGKQLLWKQCLSSYMCGRLRLILPAVREEAAWFIECRHECVSATCQAVVLLCRIMKRRMNECWMRIYKNINHLAEWQKL